MYCPRCGDENAAGRRSCAQCAEPLGPRDGSAGCPSCGAPVSTLDRYCWSCGAPINQSSGPVDWMSAAYGRADAASPSPWMFGEAPVDENDRLGRLGESELVSANAAENTSSSALDLPEWLQDESDPSSFDFEPPELELIDDGDLPAWIPELAKTETGEYDQPPPARPKNQPAAMQREPVVPPVSRAWLRQPSPHHAPGEIVNPKPAEMTDASEPLPEAPAEEAPGQAAPSPVATDNQASEARIAAGAEMGSEEVPPVQASSEPPEEPLESDEAPEVAEAAGSDVTPQAAPVDDAAFSEEVAVAAAGTEAPPAASGEVQDSSRTAILIGALIILAIIVVVVLIIIFLMI